MAASVDRTTLVPGETVTDLVTRFKALIEQETDPTKKAAMEAQLQEKEEAIRNKRYRCVRRTVVRCGFRCANCRRRLLAAGV